MSVVARIESKIPTLPYLLETPSGKEFTVLCFDENKKQVIIETGKKPSKLGIPFSALEETPNFLRGKGWLKIGAIHADSDEISLDNFLKNFSHGTSTASYVAPLLELAGIVEIERKRPAKIKLKA